MLKGSRGSLHNKLGQQLGSRALDMPATARRLVGSAITLLHSCVGLVQRDTGPGGGAWHPSPAVTQSRTSPFGGVQEVPSTERTLGSKHGVL